MCRTGFSPAVRSKQIATTLTGPLRNSRWSNHDQVATKTALASILLFKLSCECVDVHSISLPSVLALVPTDRAAGWRPATFSGG